MSDNYSLNDLTELMATRTSFPATPLASESHFYDSSILYGCHTEFGLNTTNTMTLSSTAASASVAVCGSVMDGGNSLEDGAQSRWPRQETLTLLEIRSLLDDKFKDATQKGPLWDEVSRIMRDEYGYQRSGRKCREKFENLYKYYKKTKASKTGQDGKSYRFFRQLEALYAETSNQASNSETTHLQNNLLYTTVNGFMTNQANQEPLQDQKLCESLNLSNSSEFEISSSENNEFDLSAIAHKMNDNECTQCRRLLPTSRICSCFPNRQSFGHNEKKKRGNEYQSFGRIRKSWKEDMKDLVGSHMRKLFETQEAWMEKMLRTIENNEQERKVREEEWRKQEAARFNHEYEFWANERARFDARNFVLMESLQKLAKGKTDMAMPKGLRAKQNSDDMVNGMHNSVITSTAWIEPEISSLQLRTSMEPIFQECGYSKESFWE